jgi:hypothetical protein
MGRPKCKYFHVYNSEAPSLERYFLINENEKKIVGMSRHQIVVEFDKDDLTGDIYYDNEICNLLSDHEDNIKRYLLNGYGNNLTGLINYCMESHVDDYCIQEFKKAFNGLKPLFDLHEKIWDEIKLLNDITIKEAGDGKT